MYILCMSIQLLLRSEINHYATTTITTTTQCTPTRNSDYISKWQVIIPRGAAV